MKLKWFYKPNLANISWKCTIIIINTLFSIHRKMLFKILQSNPLSFWCPLYLGFYCRSSLYYCRLAIFYGRDFGSVGSRMRFLWRCISEAKRGRVLGFRRSFVGVCWLFESHKNRMASAASVGGKPIDLLNCSAKYKSIHTEGHNENWMS